MDDTARTKFLEGPLSRLSRFPFVLLNAVAQLKRASLLGAIALAVSSNAVMAMPIIQLDWVNSGQTLSPTDQIVVQTRITNIGDSDLINASVGGSFLIPQPAYDQYLWTLSGFPSFPGPLSLSVGESYTWNFTTLETYPITGDRGDPVPLGEYFLDTDSLTLTFSPNFGLNPEGTFSALAPESRFVWTVADAASVPEPALGIPAGVGLLILFLYSRMRRKKGDSLN